MTERLSTDAPCARCQRKTPSKALVEWRTLDGTYVAQRFCERHARSWEFDPSARVAWDSEVNHDGPFVNLGELYGPPDDSLFEAMPENNALNRCRVCGGVCSRNTEGRDGHLNKYGCHLKPAPTREESS